MDAGDYMNLQHNLAEWIACLFKEQSDSEVERALIVYGIEIFLNEFLKLLFVLFIALLTGELKIAILDTTYLLLARRYSGGKHFESNVMCTLFTVFTAFVGPLLAVKVDMPLWFQICAGVVETCLIFVFVPYVEESKILDNRQRQKRKAAACFLLWIFVVIARLLGGASFVNGILFVEMIVILAVLDFKRYE